MSTFLLSALVNPEVGHPLCAGEHWTGSMSCHFVSLPVLEKIVPECCSSLLWPKCKSEMWEDSCSSLLNIGFIDEQGCYTVPCPQTGKSILFFPARKVKVWLVVASYAIVGHLQLLAGLHVEPGELMCSPVDRRNVLMLVLLKPGRLRHPVVRRLQFACQIILDSGTLEPRCSEILDRFDLFVRDYVMVDNDSGLWVHLLLLDGANKEIRMATNGVTTHELASNYLRYKLFPSAELLVVDSLLTELLLSLLSLFQEVHLLVCVSKSILPALDVASALLLQRFFVVPLVPPPSRMLWIQLQHFIGQLQGSSYVAGHVGREREIFKDVRPGDALLSLVVVQPHSLLHPDVGVEIVTIVVTLPTKLKAVIGSQLRAVILAIENPFCKAFRVKPIGILKPHQTCSCTVQIFIAWPPQSKVFALLRQVSEKVLSHRVLDQTLHLLPH